MANGPRPYGIMGGILPPPPRESPAEPAFCLFGDTSPSSFGSSPAKSSSRVGGGRKNISEALSNLMQDSQFTSTLEPPPLLWIVKSGWTKIALRARDRLVGFGHELTRSLEDRWSILIGLVVTVLASLCAWLFSPKGENRTYGPPSLKLVVRQVSCLIADIEH
ncbi:MAG: hypothetical protein Q9160_004291 [Pyrenula sp. 1 TL-2023]